MRTDFELNRVFPSVETGDMCVIFNTGAKDDKMPVDRAAIKKGEDFEALNVSMFELGRGVLVAAWPEPYDSQSCGPEIPAIRAEGPSALFRRNGDPSSNFFTAEQKGPPLGRLWIHNAGEQSLRVQTENGPIYRIHAGYTQVLDGSGPEAQIGPAQILLDLGGNALDLLISAVHVRYGASAWVYGGADCACGSQLFRYIHRIFCGDDCLGILEASGGNHVPAVLAPMDLQSYGPSRWFVRNRGGAPIPLDCPGGEPIPADGRVYSLEALMGEEAHA